MNEKIKEFQEDKCINCKNKHSSLCEIVTSSIDGHVYCKSFDDEITVFRFMSKREFENFKEGKKLSNNTIHKAKTNSIGFCFINIEDYAPEKALHFLSGIVSFDVCVVFKTKIKYLNKSYGVYAKHIKSTGNILEDLMNIFNGFNEKFKANEYCTTEYNNKDFKVIKYSENLWKQWQPSKEQQKIKWIEV